MYSVGSITSRELIMEKQTLTFADQEIANRLASRSHFLKDVDQLIDWKRINKLISRVEIKILPSN